LFTGEVAAVEAALRAGVSRAEGQGLVLGAVVIPSPHPDLIASLLS
ncbi:MAG: BMC domain-containing protein, partial [Candidatus Hodarchaeales archaeon]